jgi:hypothetical protein
MVLPLAETRSLGVTLFLCRENVAYRTSCSLCHFSAFFVMEANAAIR